MRLVKKLCCGFLSMVPVAALGQTSPIYAPNGATAPVSPTFSYSYPSNYPSGVLVNWVQCTTPRAPVTDTSLIDGLAAEDRAIQTSFSDGLGRPVQQLIDLAGPKDIVATSVYDSFGRQPVSLLPYSTTSYFTAYSAGNYYGTFKPAPFSDQASYYTTNYPSDNVPYGMTQYDDATPYRAVTQMKPGASFTGSQLGATTHVFLNQAEENIPIWDAGTPYPTSSGVWGDGTLLVKETIDESGNSSREYIDKEGKLILKKVQAVSFPDVNNTGWLCTYYVYDQLNRLACVIPPAAVNYLETAAWVFPSSPDIFDEYCYSYTYDNRGRTTIKKLPGRSAINIVYDTTDKPVLVQDGVLSVINQWMFTKYDVLGRVILTGNYSNPSSYDAPTLTSMLQTASSDPFVSFLQTPIYHNSYDTLSTVPNSDIYTINYFDDYSMIPSYYGYSNAIVSSLPTGHDADPSSQSLQTYTMPIGGYVRIMAGVIPSTLWTSSVRYYDPKGRVIEAQSENAKAGLDSVSMLYNFSGSPLSTYSSQYNPAALGSICRVPWVTIAKQYFYDGNNRLEDVYYDLNNAGASHELLAMVYDDFGRPSTKIYGADLERQAYTYRIWGDLESINKNFCQTGSGGNFFGEVLYYDYGFNTTYPNGMPAGMEWRLQGSPTIARAYGYNYDNANRLTLGGYTQNTAAAPSTFTNALENYTADNISYDLNGNLTAMRQWGTKSGYAAPFIMNDLTYRYNNTGLSNKLQAVDDAITTNYDLGEFFQVSGTTPTDYNYDDNGNVTADANKAITSISYNYNNKPYKITYSGGRTIIFNYDATGKLLGKQVVPIGAPVQTTEYIGGLEYDNDTLATVAHDAGRARPIYNVASPGDTQITYEFDYFITDHQNNVRSVVTQAIDNNWWKQIIFPNGPVPLHWKKTVNPDPVTIPRGNISPLTMGYKYYLATSELANADVERATFSNVDATRADKPDYTDSSDVKAAQLNPADSTGQSIGPSIVLRVMAGDSIRLSTSAYYDAAEQNDSSMLSPSQVISNLLGALSTGGGLTALAEGGVDMAAAGNSLQSDLEAAVEAETGQAPVDTGQPQAFLNYVLLDDNMQPVPGGSGYVQVTAANANNWHDLSVPMFRVPTSGYLVGYVSNASPMTINFNNLSLVHYVGSLLAENNYYPYGLTITTNAVTTVPDNNILYQSRRLHHNEFSDGTGLNWYYSNARFYDPQIGRWHSYDPLSENQHSYSPYHDCYNNPVVFTDPSGMQGANGYASMINHYFSYATRTSTQAFYGNWMVGVVLGSITATSQGNGPGGVAGSAGIDGSYSVITDNYYNPSSGGMPNTSGMSLADLVNFVLNNAQGDITTFTNLGNNNWEMESGGTFMGNASMTANGASLTVGFFYGMNPDGTPISMNANPDGTGGKNGEFEQINIPFATSNAGWPAVANNSNANPTLSQGDDLPFSSLINQISTAWNNLSITGKFRTDIGVQFGIGAKTPFGGLDIYGNGLSRNIYQLTMTKVPNSSGINFDNSYWTNPDGSYTLHQGADLSLGPVSLVNWDRSFNTYGNGSGFVPGTLTDQYGGLSDNSLDLGFDAAAGLGIHASISIKY